jgi:hypothetical protein
MFAHAALCANDVLAAPCYIILVTQLQDSWWDSEASLGIQSRVSPMQNTGAELVSPVTVRLAHGLSSAISAVSTPNLLIIGLRTCMLSSQFSTITTFLASQEAGRCRVTVIGI